MNLRTLKKLSKRAAPLLPLLGDKREQFRADREGGHVDFIITDRKHWSRSHCHPTYEACGKELVYTTRAGRRTVMRSPSDVRKGTVMVGAMSGYYEPEWSEETAYGALLNLVHVHFTDWSTELPRPTRMLRTPREVFSAAGDMVRELRTEASA